MKAALLNDFFARRFHGSCFAWYVFFGTNFTFIGKLILRFDDTNPSKENMEFEESIIEDLHLIGAHVSFSSSIYLLFDMFHRPMLWNIPPTTFLKSSFMLRS